ncbi:MAG TPA: phage shock protein operon transcriptional activator [Chitinispirillaceae bacterium]|nr:phage shock protein operon transcriptional activator [Chitinispirillaceae bacterium]
MANAENLTNEAIGNSESFLAFQESLSRLAKVDRPVLIVGERGTGKELAAARLHFLSNRWQESFVALNCATLPQSLVEAELFGYEPGAFTGAIGKRKGRFELADKGTLFLDEIGNMPREVQEKILRVIEYGMFNPVGSSISQKVDVRIIGATNADLPVMCAEGRFMRDLLDRLSFEVLVLPPLRERGKDILLLANHFAVRMAMHLGKQDVPVFTQRAQDALLNYPWPGNIRECKNVVERSVYRSDSMYIDDIIFDPFVSGIKGQDKPHVENKKEIVKKMSGSIDLSVPLDKAIADIERGYLEISLTNAKYNQKKAANLLGMTYHQFRRLYRKNQGEEDVGER